LKEICVIVFTAWGLTAQGLSIQLVATAHYVLHACLVRLSSISSLSGVTNFAIQDIFSDSTDFLAGEDQPKTNQPDSHAGSLQLLVTLL